jgi:hypothetical protein
MIVSHEGWYFNEREAKEFIRNMGYAHLQALINMRQSFNTR